MRTLPCHLPGVHLSELCAKKLSLVGGGALWWAHVVAVTGEARINLRGDDYAAREYALGEDLLQNAQSWAIAEVLGDWETPGGSASIEPNWLDATDRATSSTH